ncbi:MAG: hypothetical protein HN700_20010 [Verrucomicrobia bacterium]|jgi:glycerol uptake operon antiterminator|nr:hypothetical protein [Verrucomicrobiota bacterium]
MSDDPVDPAQLPPCDLLFAEGGSLTTLPKTLERLSVPELADVPLFLHVDFLQGLAKDDDAVHYLAALPRVNGIISVNARLLTLARKAGLLTVLRIFLQDSRSVGRGLKMVRSCRPNAVEILPAVAGIDVIDDFRSLGIPLLASGLLRDHATCERVLAAGFDAISASSHDILRSA